MGHSAKLRSLEATSDSGAKSEGTMVKRLAQMGRVPTRPALSTVCSFQPLPPRTAFQNSQTMLEVLSRSLVSKYLVSHRLLCHRISSAPTVAA